MTVSAPLSDAPARRWRDPKVVLVSDTPTRARAVLRRLESRFFVLHVSTTEGALAALDSGDVAVVLTDQPPTMADDLLTRLRIQDPRVIGLHLPTSPEAPEQSAQRPGSDDALVAAVQRAVATHQAIRDRFGDRPGAADLEHPPGRVDDGRLVQCVADGLVQVDAAGIVRYANPRAVAMLGRPAAELIGTGEADLFYELVSTGRVFSPPRSIIAVAIQAGTAVRQVQARFVRSDGSPFPVELSIGPIIESGMVLGAVVSFRDVSVRVAVDAMKDEFVSVVSHELRTPLAAIRGSLGLLAAGKGCTLSPPGERMMTIALESSLRLGRLIEDMLDVEAMEVGSIRFVPQDCDAATLIRTAMNECSSLAGQHGITLATDGTTETVQGDPDRIVQVLTNLLVNAIKFSPAGETVTVSVCRRDDLVEFAVIDRGCGIPADKTAHVFERFGQVNSSDTRGHGGVGLGLTICRDLVRLHRGQIWVVSTLGEGSTFLFTLPRA